MAQYKQRINKSKGVMMVTVALFFDVAQMACKLFILFGLGILGGVVGGYLGSLVGLTEIGGGVGFVVGTVATYTGVGTVFAAQIGFALSIVFSALVAVIGYSVMLLWFTMGSVSPFLGKKVGKKISAMMISAVIDITPLLNLLPGITVWTILMIRASREEDKEQAEKDSMQYNMNIQRMARRRVGEQPQAANDNEQNTQDSQLAA